MPIILDGNGIIKNINFQHPSASATNLSLNSDGTIGGAIPYPNRNLIYNGACQIHQRSASVASITTSGYYTADRWDLEISSLGTWTQSIENDAPTGSGFRKSLKMLCTTADASPSASDYAIIQQKLEGQDLQRVAKGTSSAQQLTLSFWVKSNITGTYIANLTDADNSSGGISRFNSQIYVINNSATWEKKTITFVSDTSGILDNDNAISLYVRFWLGAGSTFTSGTLRSSSWSSTSNNEYAAGQTNLAAATNNYWQITGVQLETGSIATPFEFKNYGQELRECQRYFVGFDSPQAYTPFGYGNTVTATRSIIRIPLPVAMRVPPTISVNNVANFRLEMVGSYAGNLSSFSQSGNMNSVYLAVLDMTHLTYGITTSHDFTALVANNTTNAFLSASAEL